MQFLRIAFIGAAVFLFATADFMHNSTANAASKPPEVEVTEMSLHRKEGRIEVDTTVRNVGPKTLNGLTAVYHFFAPGHVPITTQRTAVDESVLPAGADAAVHAQLEEPARAVSVEFSAVDGSGRELRIKNAGPFPIE